MYIHYHNANINTRNMTGNCIRLICIVKYLLFRNILKIARPYLQNFYPPRTGNPMCCRAFPGYPFYDESGFKLIDAAIIFQSQCHKVFVS
jgi:hypothetical protein